MYIEIVSPDKKIFTGEIHLVQLPGTIGSFEIMNNHAPIISTLEKGRIKIISPEGDVKYFEIEGGVVEVSKNVITVLTETI
jgi:F-type H+-transporting ATPase subunit epsilon